MASELEGRKKQTKRTNGRSVHFTPDGSLHARYDGTTLGIVTSTDLNLEDGEAEPMVPPHKKRDGIPCSTSPQSNHHVREHIGRRKRPNSLTVSHTGYPSKLTQRALGGLLNVPQ